MVPQGLWRGLTAPTKNPLLTNRDGAQCPDVLDCIGDRDKGANKPLFCVL
jgi:hypothetical protein